MKHAEARIRRSAIIWDAINGLSGTEIAEKHSMSVRTIQHYCSKAGIGISRKDGYGSGTDRADKYWNKHAPMVAYYFEGNSLDDTGKKFGNITRERVRQIINECGFKPRKGTAINAPIETLTKDRFHRLTFVQKLWLQVDIKDANECWNWTGSTWNGYGRTYYPARRQGKSQTYNIYSQRLAFTLTHRRQLKPKHIIINSCHNSLCCNPAHLKEVPKHEWATNRNTSPKWIEFQRKLKTGEIIPNSGKYSKEQVQKALQLRNVEHLTYSAIEKETGIHRRCLEVWFSKSGLPKHYQRLLKETA